MQPVLMNQGIGSNALACDSMKLVLHQSVFPYTTVASHTDLLSTDGTVSSTFNVLPGPYYIELQHRNAVQVWSATPVWFTGSGVTYDFRDAATKAYGGDQRPVGNGWWALYSGDLNGDENVDLLDHSLIEADILNFGFGYFSTDLNGDGNVDLLDMPILEGNIINFIYAMHP